MAKVATATELTVVYYYRYKNLLMTKTLSEFYCTVR